MLVMAVFVMFVTVSVMMVVMMVVMVTSCDRKMGLVVKVDNLLVLHIKSH